MSRADGTRECPGPCCTRRVARDKHWAQVSKGTQRRVYAAYGGGDLAAHAAAMEAAIAEMKP